jgi:hypothetical protein
MASVFEQDNFTISSTSPSMELNTYVAAAIADHVLACAPYNGSLKDLQQANYVIDFKVEDPGERLLFRAEPRAETDSPGATRITLPYSEYEDGLGYNWLFAQEISKILWQNTHLQRRESKIVPWLIRNGFGSAVLKSPSQYHVSPPKLKHSLKQLELRPLVTIF